MAPQVAMPPGLFRKLRTKKTKWRGEELKFYWRPHKKSDDSVIKEVVERRTYEKQGVELKDSVWLDAGAHIGTFTLCAAMAGSRVIAYEPHPENFALLKENLRRNGCAGRVRAQKKALGLKHGSAKLHLAPYSTSFHSTYQEFTRNALGSIEVSMVDIRAVLRDNPDIDSLKLDIEGEEIPILETLKMPDRIKQVTFEWDFKRDRETARLRRVIKTLKKAGFDVKVQLDKVFKVKTWSYWPSGVMVWAVRK
mmetsp:Transcript_76510/g.212498  ORF Transcript_76510/g.212498 Transcript_76510/m.212498 type:complete len:251 (-) Transcript_76510:70-822(-)